MANKRSALAKCTLTKSRIEETTVPPGVGQVMLWDGGFRRSELAQLERDRHIHILTGERAIDDRGIAGERIHLPETITKLGRPRCSSDAVDARGDRSTAAPLKPAAFFIPHRRPAQRLDQSGGGAAASASGSTT
jgi:hypothetical protein